MANITTEICGMKFPNPVFTAAGPTAADYKMLLKARNGGAGGIVTKTMSITPAKVPIPNISYLAPNSLMNAELWSEMDYKKFISEELTQIRNLNLPVIASVGYSPEDLAILGKELKGKGLVDAVEFSIHYVDKNADNLRRTASALKENVDVPVFAKFSPAIGDLPLAVTMLDDVVDGYIAVNSVGPALDFNIKTLKPYLGSSDGRGWMSGKAILPIGLHFVAAIYSLSKKPVIGVGGVRAVEDVVKYLMAGASAVQVCSLSILKGQNVYGKLASDLNKWMNENSYPDINSIRGIFHKQPKEDMHYLYQGRQVFPMVDLELCDKCGACVKICVHEALGNGKSPELNKDLCVRCGLCTQICPKDALQMKEEII